MSQLALCFYGIVRAHERMAKLAHRAPVLTFSTVDTLAGARVFLSVKTFSARAPSSFPAPATLLWPLAVGLRHRSESHTAGVPGVWG
jgi:hypothetical protein